MDSVAKRRHTASHEGPCLHVSWLLGSNEKLGLGTLLLQPQTRQGSILPFMPVVVGDETPISGPTFTYISRKDVKFRSSQAPDDTDPFNKGLALVRWLLSSYWLR